MLSTAETTHPLRNVILSVTKDSTVYFLGAALIGLGNIVLVPLFIRRLTPSEFGLYALLEISLTIVLAITQLGFGSAYLRWFANLKTSEHGKLLGTSLLTLLFTATGIGGIYWLLLASSLGTRFFHAPVVDYAGVLILLVLFETLQIPFMTDLRARRRPVAFSITASLRLLTTVGATLWLVLQGHGIYGILLGRLIGSAAAIAILSGFCLPTYRLGISMALFKPMLKFGLPLVWSSLVGLAFDAAGRFSLATYGTMDQVGFYALALKLTAIMRIAFIIPFASAWNGVQYQIFHWPHAKILYNKLLGYAFILGLAIATTIILFAPFLVKIFANMQYVSVIHILPWLILPLSLRVLEYRSVLGIYLKGKTFWMPIISSIGLIVNLIGNYLLVPTLGMYGAAYSWIFAVMITIFISSYISSRYYSLPSEGRIIVLPILLWFIAMLVNRSLPETVDLSRSLVATGSIVTLAAILMYWDYYKSKNLFIIRNAPQ